MERAMIDIYCERTHSGFWAEPLNAMTNSAFIVAALLCVYFYKKSNASSSSIVLLIVLLFCIGVGSFLFHTFATAWAMVLDVVPILVFQISYLWIYSRCLLKFKFLHSVVLLFAFFALGILFSLFPEGLNGSLSYAPAWIAMLILGVVHYRMQKAGRGIILVAAILFFLSLIFRSIDLLICGHVACGTHFLWHLLNAGVLFLLIYALLPPGRGRTSMSGCL